MIFTKKDLKKYLYYDAIRNGVNYRGLLNRIKYILRVIIGSENYCAFRYIKCLRYTEFHLNNKTLYHKVLYYIYRVKLIWLGRKYNIYISLNTCGYGLRILHLSGGGGVLLNVKKVGVFCGFNSGVLIGNKGDNEHIVTIGDYTAFGPGAKALGKINIGNNVFIAANSVVVKDVPDNSIYGGVPAKFIKSQTPRNNTKYDYHV